MFGLCAGAYVTHVCQVSADWERASLRPSSQPGTVFKPSPVMGTYTTDGGFINTNLVTADEESQEFDDLIFALKTGEDPCQSFIVWPGHDRQQHEQEFPVSGTQQSKKWHKQTHHSINVPLVRQYCL